MGKLLFTGGTVVTADATFRADVLVEDERIAAVGTDLPVNDAETVDASGRLVMPGFIDAHTHMDMPFGGTVTADDWATGTESAAAGGTTMIIDFALQEEGGTLAGAFEAWTEKARDKAVIDYGFHVAITDLREDAMTLGVREGKLSENQLVAVLSTNQARIYGAFPRKGALVPGADADIVLWDPELSVTATVDNRHGSVDYTPYEGMTFTGGPAAVYVRGNLVYRDGEVVGERGSGRFVERSFVAPGLEVRA